MNRSSSEISVSYVILPSWLVRYEYKPVKVELIASQVFDVSMNVEPIDVSVLEVVELVLSRLVRSPFITRVSLFI